MTVDKPFSAGKIVARGFRWPGAKNQLGRDILSKAPIKRGGKFCDVCGGRGGLTFWAWELKLEFREWIINDPTTAPFFRALRDIGHEVRVPPRSRPEFERQAVLAAQGDQGAILLESWLCYNGGTYTSGGWSSSGGRRSPDSYEGSLRAAHNAIVEKKPLITSFDWLDCIRRMELGKGDLVVLDGPYVDANVAPYKAWNILPIEVIAEFKSAGYDWILCEELQPMYVEAFGEPVLTKRVQNRASNFAVTGGQQKRIECVWTSESYKAHLDKTGGKMPQVLHATLRLTPIKDDGSWTIQTILKELRAVADKIEKNKLEVSAEERQRLLPLLIILKKLTKRRKPGYHAALDSIGLNASTVRSWFYRGHHTDEIIAMLEPKPSPVPVHRGREKVEARGGNADDDAADLTQRFLLQADKIVTALLGGKIEVATRLGREYASARKLMIGPVATANSITAGSRRKEPSSVASRAMKPMGEKAA